ncbi:hypothetical protein [Ferrovibrio sp.]|uniref:hypothetical protein n=1 Tax=Ferrovibrio sp. TaxID=1917215 RepID=UPI0026103A18|nr:hypothetical protein [Ferrovibrio sp.]
MLLAANPVLQAARDYWRALPKPVNIPDIRLIDAATLPRVILPHIIIAEITHANFDLGRLRLCGHEIARWFREMPEGMDAQAFASLTEPAYARHMRALLAELIQRRKPVYCKSVYTLAPLEPGGPDNVVTAERLALPLADGATAVECLIIVETLTASDSRAGPLRLLPPEPGVTVTHGPFEVAG